MCKILLLLFLFTGRLLLLFTLIFSYIDGLTEHLTKLYPLHQEPQEQKNLTLLHIYYPGELNYHAVVPLAFTYLSIFFYIYFSVGKMELIKSKVS
jgi:hypothetical protein